LLVLGIDPGSITTGWALLRSEGNKIHYVSSGVLSFDKSTDFLQRLSEIKEKSDQLFGELSPDEISFESLIYVKSPTALIKLAQTRGILLSACVEKYKNKIYEYSPNFIKSSTVGHGHADKQSVQKFLDMLLGKRDYQTHDESDAVIIALCHILNRRNSVVDKSRSLKDKKVTTKKTSRAGRGLAASLAHKVKG